MSGHGGCSHSRCLFQAPVSCPPTTSTVLPALPLLSLPRPGSPPKWPTTESGTKESKLTTVGRPLPEVTIPATRISTATASAESTTMAYAPAFLYLVPYCLSLLRQGYDASQGYDDSGWDNRQSYDQGGYWPEDRHQKGGGGMHNKKRLIPSEPSPHVIFLGLDPDFTESDVSPHHPFSLPRRVVLSAYAHVGVPTRCKHTSRTRAAASSRSPSYETDLQALAPSSFIAFRSALTTSFSVPPPYLDHHPQCVRPSFRTTCRCLQGLRLRSIHKHRTRPRFRRPLVPVHTDTTAGLTRSVCDDRILPRVRSWQPCASGWASRED